MMPLSVSTRRDFFRFSTVMGAGLILAGCGRNEPRPGQMTDSQKSAQKNEPAQGGDVTAVEDLMREHGVLRRVLFVYSEMAARLRARLTAASPEALLKAATLFRAFGEEYHEKKLEEAFIFPAAKRSGGPAAGYPEILAAQHQRGREITDYILSATRGTGLGHTQAEPLARALESLVRMYRPHAAAEDTIVFPAWKRTLSPQELDEMGDRFEEIEQQQFGKDGFEDAVRQIGEIERSLALADLAQFTAIPPPGL